LDKYNHGPLKEPQLEALEQREAAKKAAEGWLPIFLRSFGYAFEGIYYTLRTQRNMRVHLGIGLVAVGLGLWLGLSLTEWAVLLVMMALVYCLEMLNTVVEALVDLVTDRYQPLAKVAKDVAAGVVLVAALFAVGIGLLLFGPRLVQLIFH
jgi:diacylglycerol kinase